MDKHEMEKKDSASNLVELIDARVNRATDAALDKAVKTKSGVVVSYDDSAHCAVVNFPEEGSGATYLFYNKTPEVLDAGDTVRVFYTNNLARGWIGERCGEPNVKKIELYGGEGVGRPAPWDKTSEYFNSYGVSVDGNTPVNIAGTQGKTRYFATAKGFATKALGQYSYTEGFSTSVDSESQASHAEGFACAITKSRSAHAEGEANQIINSDYSHAEGQVNQLQGSPHSHVCGAYNNIYQQEYGHVSGQYHTLQGAGLNNCVTGYQINLTQSSYCEAYGRSNTVLKLEGSSVGGQYNVVNRPSGYNVDLSKVASITGVFVLGESNQIYTNVNDRLNKQYSGIDGFNDNSGLTLDNTVVFGHANYISGRTWLVSGLNCASTGGLATIGENCISTGGFAEGLMTHAFGENSHSMGSGTTAGGKSSLSIGYHNKALGENSFAGGLLCNAYGENDFVFGEHLRSSQTGSNQFVIGKYNDDTNIDDYLFVVGNGLSETTTNEDGEVVTEIKKNNAFAVDKNGYIYCKGIKNFDSNSDSFIPYTTEQAVSSAKSIFASVMEV